MNPQQQQSNQEIRNEKQKDNKKDKNKEKKGNPAKDAEFEQAFSDGRQKPILGIRTCIVNPTLAASITNKCRNCHAIPGMGSIEKLLQCSRCHEVKYCDVECQKWDWFLRHKNECSLP